MIFKKLKKKKNKINKKETDTKKTSLQEKSSKIAKKLVRYVLISQILDNAQTFL